MRTGLRRPRSTFGAHLTGTGGAHLCGPLWALTTLIFFVFLLSSLAASISAYFSASVGGNEDGAEHNFSQLSVAWYTATGWRCPSFYGLRCGIWYVCVNSRRGAWHALFSLCDTNVLAVIPVRPLRWSLVGLAFALSGSFLDRNGYTVLASAEARATRLLIVLVAALQVGLAITFKVLFFSYYILVPNAPVASTPPSGGDAGGNTTATGVGEVLTGTLFPPASALSTSHTACSMSAPTDPQPLSPGLSLCDPGRKDLTLCSSDGAAFYVHRLVLSLASPVFEDMFDVSQPDSKQGAPEVLMPHTAVVLEWVLQFFYPGTQLVVETLGQLHEILEILIDTTLSRSLHSAGCASPRVHRLAARRRLCGGCSSAMDRFSSGGGKRMAEDAPAAWDRDLPEELRYITGTLYQRLMQYHYRCGQAGKQLATTSFLTSPVIPSAPTHPGFSPSAQLATGCPGSEAISRKRKNNIDGLDPANAVATKRACATARPRTQAVSARRVWEMRTGATSRTTSPRRILDSGILPVYFDVDARIVLSRCLATTLNPFSSHADLLGTHLARRWCGPLRPFLDAHYPRPRLVPLVLPRRVHLGSDFGLLSVAVPLVYSYGLALPVVLWVALQYLGMGEWSVVEAIAM
ncbi:hypothetical protein K438DRAFT_1974711 [Mycena galopus ATCC 62051]|nr:hypothetical protein K438DRAFT_1974711 [Mycena galopus ATCC 62051]